VRITTPAPRTIGIGAAAGVPVQISHHKASGRENWGRVRDSLRLIEDARGREAEFTLDRNGFALVHAPTRVNDFYSPEEVKGVYYPEVERLLKEQLGASRVFAFDHVVRNAGLPDGRTPSRQVHNDHTVNSAPRRVRDHLGADAQELLLAAIDQHIPPVDQDAMRELVAKGTFPVFLQVDALDAVFESLRAAGAEIL